MDTINLHFAIELIQACIIGLVIAFPLFFLLIYFIRKD